MTKYSATIKNPKDILYELGKAYTISNSDRPGPVWIDVPLDIQGAEIDENICSIFNTKNNFKRITDDQKLSFVKLLQNSKKPLIIIGNGINLSQTNKELEDFLLLTGIPIVTGPHSGIDAVDNTYEYYCGRIGILGQLTSNEIVQQADLIICLGTRLPLKMTGYNINEFSPNSKKIIVDIDENEILKHKFNIDLTIIADLKTFFKDISDIVYTLDISNWQKHTKNIRLNQKYYYDKHKNLKNYTSFYYLINKSSNIFKEIPIVTSNGTAHVVTMQNYLINKNQRVFTNVGCASMGYGLPAAIGASIANNNKQVICIEGDGSIMMNLQELQTVIAHNLPIKLLIINNDGYLSIKLSQESFFNGQEFASGPENGVTLPSYEKIANAFNIKYMSIKNNEEIDTILKQMVDYPKACIVEVFTHPKERHEPKVTHKGIDKNGNIIPGTLTDMVVSESF
jgi:acetolactate synthase-1/2/3 large subunit